VFINYFSNLWFPNLTRCPEKHLLKGEVKKDELKITFGKIIMKERDMLSPYISTRIHYDKRRYTTKGDIRNIVSNKSYPDKIYLFKIIKAPVKVDTERDPFRG
jgi:hypothetical protein